MPETRIGVDIGGTFTDVAFFDPALGTIRFGKSLSTPADLVQGVRASLARVADSLAAIDLLIHGSTVVINAVLQRTGVKTALVTTAGFRDVYEIGRINRPDSFNLYFRKHRPLIPRALIFEVPERMLADGTELIPLDEREAQKLARRIKELRVEAVCVLFLHSYRAPEHERRMAEILREECPDVFVSASHELSREYREFERTSTVAANAYVGPLVDNYLGRLEQTLGADGFQGRLMIMQSSGGLCDVGTARRQCVQMMESGPAGGVQGALAVAEALGLDRVIAFDMGGTTAKACVIRDGAPELAADYFVGGRYTGLPIRLPVLDIHEVGTGGGSIARVDEAGGLHVGPESAGSSPGPACFGRGGTQATLTDADLVLGWIDAGHFLGGEMGLDVAAAREAIRRQVAMPLGLSLERAASGMLEIGVASMANGVRAVTLERGLDPRDFALVAYGGGGPLHASAVAEELGMRQVVIPVAPAYLSALGMLTADLRRDYVLTHFARLDELCLEQIDELCSKLEQQGREELAALGVEAEDVAFEQAADLRYVGQEHTATLRVPRKIVTDEDRIDLEEAFHAHHAQRFGHSAPGEQVELVGLRVSAVGRVEPPPARRLEAGTAKPPQEARIGERRVSFGGDAGPVLCPVFDREKLLAGNCIDGPAVVEEAASSTLLRAGDCLRVAEQGHLIVQLRPSRAHEQVQTTDAAPGRMPADAITEEVVRSALVAITDEMKTNLMRTAYHPVIYEALDFTVGLFDTEGRTISIGLGLPLFIRGLSDAIKRKIAYYGLDGMEPGDVLLTNDSYMMGSHLNHLVFTLPIFWQGRVVAFASSMAHWQDVGGVLGGVTRDIYSEGLQIPLVKIFKRGQQDAELTAIIEANVRLPELAMGDFRAQVAAIRTGERRFTALLERYGDEAVLGGIQRLFAHSERQARAAVLSIPDGVYEAESFMDDDGVTIGKRIPIRVRVIVDGDQMTVDLSGVSPQVAGNVNSGETAGRAAAQVAFKFLTTPTLLPINDGSFSPLKIDLPPGRLISAIKPAAVRSWTNAPMTVADTIIRALAPAIPERVAAGHHADLMGGSLLGTDPRTGRHFHASIGLAGGGWGAKQREDGMSATVCLSDGDTHNSPTEASEVKAPVIIQEYALRQDSGGAGEYRGGLGVRRVARACAPLHLNTKFDRTQCRPWGLEGGQDALANHVMIRRVDGTELVPPNGKLALSLEEGDVWIVETGGGGGFGDPLQRDPAAVALDVQNGYVSPQQARASYGVALVAGSCVVDLPATEQLRTAMRQQRVRGATSGT